MRRDVRPLEHADHARQQRVSLEKGVVVKPDDIRVVDMMPEVLVSNVLVRSVRRAAKPAHEPSEQRVVTCLSKNKVVTTFMNQVGRNHHAMGQQDGRQQVDGPARCKQSDESQHPGNPGSI